jgi:CYTH domain-containing protein/5'-deoxynucleotidase YfbR-like HD superfamily hydrolase
MNMNERLSKQLQGRAEGLTSEKDAVLAREIATTALTLSELVEDFAQITRIPRHRDGRHENDPEHSFMVALVASAVAEKYYPDLDLGKVERFSIVHDFPEIRYGDINTFDVTPEELAEKERREQETIQELKGILPPSLAAALEEYERQDIPEAIFVRAVDKLLPTAMGVTGDGFSVVREDFGITTMNTLVESHQKVHDRLDAKFGQDFPHIIGAHALLCATFEDRIRKQLEKADTPPKTPERTFEVERKYLIDIEKLPPNLNLNSFHRVHLRQGYMTPGADGSEVRLRSFDDEKFELTYKTPGMVERGEKTTLFETRDPFDALWAQTEGRRVEKTRYVIPFDKYKIELDIYEGHLAGLATAEVEFDGRFDDARLKAATFTPPEWFGADVSEDSRYKNRNLAQAHPHDFSKLYMNL